MDMTLSRKSSAVIGAIALTALAALSSGAQARNGRNAAFAAGAAVGVVGGAALAGAAYNNNYRYGNGYGNGYGYAEPAYDPCGPYGCEESYYAPPPRVRYYAPAPAYYEQPEVVYGSGYSYGRSNHDIALERFQNRK